MALHALLWKSNSRSAALATRALTTTSNVNTSHVPQLSLELKQKYYPALGNRDIVGYGWNGRPVYLDRAHYPYPAVRWQENTNDVMALRKKEEGDWKSLSVDEKKALYRASFRYTFAEQTAPNGEWKVIVGLYILGLAATLWGLIWMKTCVLPPLPRTITEEWKEKELELMVKQNQGFITGVSSHWDYEKGQWKK